MGLIHIPNRKEGLMLGIGAESSSTRGDLISRGQLQEAPFHAHEGSGAEIAPRH